MKRISLGLAAAATVVALVGVSAAKAECDGCCDSDPSSCDACCDPCCDPYAGGLFFQAEALFFRYNRADGARAGNFNNVPAVGTDDITFDYTATPRVTLGYVFDGGLGFRARYWEYDQTGDAAFPASGVAMRVDTSTIDIELFEVFDLNDRWSVEIAAGVRYNEFAELMVDPAPAPLQTRVNYFEGWGGIVSVEGKRSLGRWGALYARGRGGILMDDALVLNGPFAVAPVREDALLIDAVHSMTELALGWEIERYWGRSLLTFRGGYEWQIWNNYTTSFTPVSDTSPARSHMAGPSDVGFNGFTLLLGIDY